MWKMYFHHFSFNFFSNFSFLLMFFNLFFNVFINCLVKHAYSSHHGGTDSPIKIHETFPTVCYNIWRAMITDKIQTKYLKPIVLKKQKQSLKAGFQGKIVSKLKLNYFIAHTIGILFPWFVNYKNLTLHFVLAPLLWYGKNVSQTLLHVQKYVEFSNEDQKKGTSVCLCLVHCPVLPSSILCYGQKERCDPANGIMYSITINWLQMLFV